VARSLALPFWPGGAEVAVSLTFDVDGDPTWLGAGPEFRARLSTLSQARYGLVRGLPRILDLLDSRSIPATFYVPGATALAYPAAVRAIVAAGHEIGHHGHDHLRPDFTDARGQRDEIERGLTALADVVGQVPRGYRAPYAELTPETFELLVEHGFDYDSSCMGDDRPYVEECGDLSILELPLHWSLDDAPYFMFMHGSGGLLRDPAEVLDIWFAEFERAVLERRHATFVMHPEVIGRGPHFDALVRLVDRIGATAPVWWARHGDVARLLGERAS
jgi:peptidoglycan/xylan/chitin deacetylase (PgdA/CDA1 family)